MITLRNLTSEDLNVLVLWWNDPTVNRYLADRLKTREELEVWFDRLKAQPNIWLRVITVTDRAVGYAVVESVDSKNRRCEISMVIGEADLWGRGIGKVVLAHMLEYAFDTLHLHRVWAVVARGNECSERLLKTSGFVQEGVMRELLMSHGEFTDILSYSMLESEYPAPKDQS